MEYLLELYLSRADASGLDAKLRQARAAAEAVAEAVADDGLPLRLLQSIYVPEDETLFLVYDAPSADPVREAARRARLPWDHLTRIVGHVESA